MMNVVIVSEGTDGAAHFYDQIMDVVKMFYNLQLF